MTKPNNYQNEKNQIPQRSCSEIFSFCLPWIVGHNTMSPYAVPPEEMHEKTC